MSRAAAYEFTLDDLPHENEPDSIARAPLVLDLGGLMNGLGATSFEDTKVKKGDLVLVRVFVPQDDRGARLVWRTR